MKILNGSELAGYIKERQAHEVRGLIQAHHISPKLAIIQCIDDPVIDTYVRLKKTYGSEILIDVDSYNVPQREIKDLVAKLNSDVSVHGIIIQLPIEDPTKTEEVVNLVNSEKDVDALGSESTYEPATPMAIMWLLAGYNISLQGIKILLVGRGKLVGAPLEKILTSAQLDLDVVDQNVDDLAKHTLEADLIITATGSPRVIKSKMIKHGAVIVDAGVASESGRTVGDLDEDVYERDDLTLTLRKGGVGPLTVCALFENVIRAASAVKMKDEL